MLSSEIRQKFLDFFKARGHAILPSAPLVPENDPTTLFNTAGMQPLVPYLLGEHHPAGVRLADAQKCIRTGDIEDVGDNRHLTFFEMLGNWSLGDYFKEESIPWSFEFLTNKEEGLGLDPDRLYVTVFKGELGIPRDEDTIRIWQEVFAKYGLTRAVAGDNEHIKDDIRIVPLGVDDNFWIAGNTGPCGGDTEIFYDTRPEEGPLNDQFMNLVSSGRLIEVWNNVFMEFNKTTDGRYEPLVKKNVDTGMGLERTTAVVNGKATVFETDLFEPLLELINKDSTRPDDKAARIIADHLKASVFMAGDGVLPSNNDRGYVMRRLIRRAYRYCDKVGLRNSTILEIILLVIKIYERPYPYLSNQKDYIQKTLTDEITKFKFTLDRGLKVFEKMSTEGKLSGKDAFDLYQSYGFPLEMTSDLAREKGVVVDTRAFEEEMKKHQDLSRQGAEQKFKGGLAGTSDQIVKYHTATHLLQQALVDVLGSSVAQKGSNITEERLRFDFSFDRKMTEEEKIKVEEIVNEKIKADLPVQKVVLSKDEAEKTGARHLFSEKYGDQVSIYFIGDSIETAYSKEFCGGPHVENTGVLGHFKITKEEAVAQGVRRIKATLS